MDLNLLQQTRPNCFEYLARGEMLVPARLFGLPGLIRDLDEQVLTQLQNVAALPGVVDAAMAMPDAHWGYGFPIGGVAAFDPDRGGVISVGGVGYDISCGVRTLKSDLFRQGLEPVLPELADLLAAEIPAGVGRGGKLKLSIPELDQVLTKGARWAVEQGFGPWRDLEYTEDQGCLSGADPDKVSKKAKQRQQNQLGTLGSGNHYLEVQYVDAVYDQETARAFGLERDRVLVSLHCGSRALGHQIGSDYIQILGRQAQRQGLRLPARDLVCARIDSAPGRDYLRAMACGTNCALANRQVLTHLLRRAWSKVLPQSSLDLVYDVSHNTCKAEEHQQAGGLQKTLYVHRKGATRAFGPERQGLPPAYRGIGQPVLIGGTMGTASYILVGTNRGEELAWGSACHGAGRAMSRKQAAKRWKGRGVLIDLERRGTLIRAASRRGAAEEAPEAYKDVSLVVDSTQAAGLARKVARVLPLVCIKG
jgi:tRNA-splicing ligase RtcB